jgi:hypothetical protein
MHRKNAVFSRLWFCREILDLRMVSSLQVIPEQEPECARCCRIACWDRLKFRFESEISKPAREGNF